MRNYHKYEFIDLGLPSGTLWATCNVGAREPDGYGEYFALDERDTAIKDNDFDCKVPSREQWVELIQYTNSKWMMSHGVNGRLFTARNGMNLFLPAAGYYWDYKSLLVGEIGSYWSSSLFKDDPSGAWSFGFSSNNDDVGLGYEGEIAGLSVRFVVFKDERC